MTKQAIKQVIENNYLLKPKTIANKQSRIIAL